MKYQNLFFFFLILIISFDIIFSSSVNFGKKEPIEVEDYCLWRPYHKRAEPFYFLPVLRAKLKNVGDKFSFPSRCFAKNIVTFKEISKGKITFTLDNFNKTDTWCSELFIFHTSDHNFLQFVIFEGTHDIVMKQITADDKDEIKINGLKLYSFCSGLGTTIKSLFTTIKSYYGGLGYDPKAKNPRYRPNIPKSMERANLRMLELFNHYTPERRKNNTIVQIDKNTIKSGDIIAILRLDGIDPMIMLGSGGRVGHCAVFTWMDGELYVVESQDGWYWPRRGVQKNKWEDWIQWAYNADFNVVILPLKEEYRNKFNVDKANEWFLNEVEGLNYGYHNFIFSWIDTPDRNMPFIGKNELVEFVFSVISKFSPSITNTMLGEGLNIRLKTEGLTYQQAIAEAARRGKSFEELIAEPELEEYTYSDGKNYVCGAFVAAFLEHGGMFDGITFSPNEFGPRDLYNLDIFDKNFTRPQACIDDNPDLPYCQVMGKFILELEKEYSTIKPYDHMFYYCPSVGPDFIRDDGC